MPAVVIAFGCRRNILTILACRNLGCRVVISERNDVASQCLEYPWEDLRWGLYNRADIVTANTRGALETMQAYVQKDKLAFLPNPIVHHEVGADTPRPASAEAPVILIVANLEQRKAHKCLVGSFRPAVSGVVKLAPGHCRRGRKKKSLCAGK